MQLIVCALKEQNVTIEQQPLVLSLLLALLKAPWVWSPVITSGHYCPDRVLVAWMGGFLFSADIHPRQQTSSLILVCAELD